MPKTKKKKYLIGYLGCKWDFRYYIQNGNYTATIGEQWSDGFEPWIGVTKGKSGWVDCVDCEEDYPVKVKITIEEI